MLPTPSVTPCENSRTFSACLPATSNRHTSSNPQFIFLSLKTFCNVHLWVCLLLGPNKLKLNSNCWMYKCVKANEKLYFLMRFYFTMSLFMTVILSPPSHLSANHISSASRKLASSKTANGILNRQSRGSCCKAKSIIKINDEFLQPSDITVYIGWPNKTRVSGDLKRKRRICNLVNLWRHFCC